MKFFNEEVVAILYIPIAISLILGSIVALCYEHIILSIIIGIFAVFSSAIYDLLWNYLSNKR